MVCNKPSMILSTALRSAPGNMPRANTATSTVALSDTAASNSEASRLIQQGGVSVNQEKLADPRGKAILEHGQDLLIKVGKKKFVKLMVRNDG